MAFSTFSSMGRLIKSSGPSVPAGVPTDGLVFYQTFNTDFSDSIGGLTMTNTGCIRNTTNPKFGTGCLSFDKNQNIRIGSFINWGNVSTNNASVSLSFWLNMTSSIVGATNGSAKEFLSLMGSMLFTVKIYFTGSTYKLSYDFIGPGTGDGALFPSAGLSLNNWNHFVFVLNNTTSSTNLKCYCNGTQVYNYSPGHAPGTGWQQFYARAYNQSAWGSGLSAYSWINNGEPNLTGNSMNFTGLFDSYRIYNRVLTQTDVTALYTES